MDSMTEKETTLEEKLKLIAKAVEEAQGDPIKEEKLLAAIIDPQDALNCDSCQ